MKITSGPIFFRVDQGAIFLFKHPKTSDICRCLRLNLINLNILICKIELL